MSPFGTSRHFAASHQFGRYWRDNGHRSDGTFQLARDLAGLRLERNDIRSTQGIQVVRPMVHHCAPLIEVFCAIVCRSDGILLLMSKLTLDDIWAETHFIERGGGHRPEAVNRRPTMIAQAV